MVVQGWSWYFIFCFIWVLGFGRSIIGHILTVWYIWVYCSRTCSQTSYEGTATKVIGWCISIADCIFLLLTRFQKADKHTFAFHFVITYCKHMLAFYLIRLFWFDSFQLCPVFCSGNLILSTAWIEISSHIMWCFFMFYRPSAIPGPAPDEIILPATESIGLHSSE